MPSDTLTLDSLQEQLQAEVAQSSYLQERLAELELALDDIGWDRLSFETATEFTREGLDRLINLSRLNTLKNPLVGRGVRVRAQYVWGQGCEVRARDETVNDLVIQPFLDDPGNQGALFSGTAAAAKSRTLSTDGNVVLVLFPNVLTGAVKVRSITVDEIRDVITNPDDASEPWFYLRRWVEREWVPGAGGANVGRTITREAWYPDWRYRPVGTSARLESINRIQVRWGSPIYHVKVGGLEGMRFGVPRTYAALDWARAYKLFLEDWATIVRSLSRFAMELTTKGKPSQAAARLGTTVTGANPRETNPAPTTGATFVAAEGTSLRAIPKTDATVNSADGIWLAKMVAAALDIPYTILMGDPDMGNLATAKTLDRPTELAMMEEQRLWADVRRDLCGYAIDWAARAPAGAISGGIVTAPEGIEVVEFTDPDLRTVEVEFPPILEDDLLPKITAIVQAWQTELPDPQTVLRLLLSALGVENVDELVDAHPEEFEARMAKQAELGQVAVDAFRQGKDPAQFVNDERDD